MSRVPRIYRARARARVHVVRVHGAFINVRLSRFPNALSEAADTARVASVRFRYQRYIPRERERVYRMPCTRAFSRIVFNGPCLSNIAIRYVRTTYVRTYV